MLKHIEKFCLLAAVLEPTSFDIFIDYSGHVNWLSIRLNENAVYSEGGPNVSDEARVIRQNTIFSGRVCFDDIDAEAQLLVMYNTLIGLTFKHHIKH